MQGAAPRPGSRRAKRKPKAAAPGSNAPCALPWVTPPEQSRGNDPEKQSRFLFLWSGAPPARSFPAAAVAGNAVDMDHQVQLLSHRAVPMPGVRKIADDLLDAGVDLRIFAADGVEQLPRAGVVVHRLALHH